MNDTLKVMKLSTCDRQSMLLESMHLAHTQFLLGKDIRKIFIGMLDVILKVSESHYGFIGEILFDINKNPYLKTCATTKNSNEHEIIDLFEKDLLKEMKFQGSKPLFIEVATNCELSDLNESTTDSESGNLHDGQSAMEVLLGIPVFFGKELIGVVGIANRSRRFVNSIIRQLDPILSTCATIIKSFREKKGHEMLLRELKERNAEFETFMYRASHDLRGPVSTIKGLVQISSVESKKTFVHQCMEMVGECANKLDNTLVDLRDIVKIKQSVVQISEIDLEAIVKMQISIFQGSRNFEKIIWNITSKVEQPFYSDLTLINIVIQNILDNSIKYINQVKRQPIIDVHISVHDDSCQLVISDNGPGIEAEYLDKVFNMFFRGNEMSEGTGVGLYLVKNAVDKLEGKIEISSEFKKGCSLKVVLPVINIKRKSRTNTIENQLRYQLTN